MGRCVFAIFLTCALVSVDVIASTAKASDYYEDTNYRNRNSDNVWYSNSCCYKKVVRHSRSVRYERIDRERRYERYGYYDQTYGSRYGYDTPRRYDNSYYAPRRDDDHSRYSSDYSGSSDVCYSRRVRVDDGSGGWVWGTTRVCD